MARSLFVFLMLATLMRGNDWTEFRMGPFEVVSSQGDREAKEVLNFLEQFRFALGSQLGQQDLESVWPVRVVVVGRKSALFPTLRFGRDAWMCSITDLSPATASSLAQVLLDSWRGTLPPPLKRGLVAAYSTLQVQGTKVTLGAVPPGRDRDWTRAHMLAVHPDYSGKLRVLLGNLGKGVDPEVAYRNAFSADAEQIERAVDKYMQAGQYGTIPAPSRPITVRQFLGKPLDAATGNLAVADVMFANDQDAARELYAAVLRTKPGTVEAQEGLGLIAARAGQRAEAVKLLADAKSAKALYEFARLTDDPAAKKDALTKAALANPRWAEPSKMLAEIETHPAQKLAALRKVTQLEPQKSQNWVMLAMVQEDARMFADSAKSWAAAERATDDPNERERVRQNRVSGELRRDEAVRAERDAQRRKSEQEMEDLRNKALMDIRKAEARANTGKPVIDAKGLDEYKEGGDNKKTSGVLARVDCLGVPARLHIAQGKRVTRILVPDPSKVAITGGGERSFGCGVQKPARRVTVDYTPRNDAQQGTTGDAVTIEFQ